MRFKEVRGEEEFVIEGYRVRRIPHIVPAYIIWNEDSFACIALLFDNGVATEAYIYANNGIPRRQIEHIVEYIAKMTEKKIREIIDGSL